jgi:hypothetical protein
MIGDGRGWLNSNLGKLAKKILVKKVLGSPKEFW